VKNRARSVVNKLDISREDFIETFAVRWARRPLKREMTMDYTKWHGACGDGSFTLCGVMIPLAIDGGTFFPETDEGTSRVDCQRCLRHMNKG
jgi:hypothetical protein